VIILVIDVYRILAFKSKGDPPIGANRYGPGTAATAFQGVKFQAWQAHVTWRSGGIQCSQDQAQPFRMLRLNPGTRTRRKELGQTLVTECPDHDAECNP